MISVIDDNQEAISATNTDSFYGFNECGLIVSNKIFKGYASNILVDYALEKFYPYAGSSEGVCTVGITVILDASDLDIYNLIEIGKIYAISINGLNGFIIGKSIVSMSGEEYNSIHINIDVKCSIDSDRKEELKLKLKDRYFAIYSIDDKINIIKVKPTSIKSDFKYASYGKYNIPYNSESSTYLNLDTIKMVDNSIMKFSEKASRNAIIIISNICDFIMEDFRCSDYGQKTIDISEYIKVDSIDAINSIYRLNPENNPSVTKRANIYSLSLSGYIY